MDANGKIVVSSYTPGNSYQIDVSFLSKGIYTLVLNTSNSVIYKKVVKQ